VLVDTHCHLADPTFEAEVGEIVSRAAVAGVGHIVVIGESPDAAARAAALAATDPRLSATAGVHPHIASTWSSETAAWMEKALTDPRVVAAGEMGLDYHYDHSPRPAQQAAFEAQMALAAAAGKPAVIHAREADQDVEAVLRNHPRTTTVLHSFSSGPELLAAGVSLGAYISLSGMVTFRSWRLDDALRAVPPDRILIETDAPYLAPVPHRGKGNEPAYVLEVARRLAQLFGMSLEEMAALTTSNAIRVFGTRVCAEGAS
jgi:TatD DNase family protein